MIDIISKFLHKFLYGSTDQTVLVILILLIALFFIITVGLFFITVYLRIQNNVKKQRDKKHHKQWDPVILQVLDNTINAQDGFKKIKRKYSISYLLYLEQYIDLLKGKEKERLITLGRLSLKKSYKLLHSNSRKKQMYGVRMLGIFHQEEQYKYLRFNHNDVELSLSIIREIRTVKDLKTKERLLKLLFLFKYVSPVYISNILVDMGKDIVPLLRLIIQYRYNVPYEQIIAIETIKRMHYAECLDMSEAVLNKSRNAGVLSSWLRYIGHLGDAQYRQMILPFISHPSSIVRNEAIQTYIAISDEISSKELAVFFNDDSVMVAIHAARKLQSATALPYVSIKEIENYKWAEIYKRMVY